MNLTMKTTLFSIIVLMGFISTGRCHLDCYDGFGSMKNSTSNMTITTNETCFVTITKINGVMQPVIRGAVDEELTKKKTVETYSKTVYCTSDLCNDVLPSFKNHKSASASVYAVMPIIAMAVITVKFII